MKKGEHYLLNGILYNYLFCNIIVKILETNGLLITFEIIKNNIANSISQEVLYFKDISLDKSALSSLNIKKVKMEIK